MHRVTLVAGIVLTTGGAGLVAAPQQGGTLNYRDVTAPYVHQAVAEQSNNEKEVELGDFDNDGDLDVVIAVAYSDFGQRRNKLYRNDGGHFFEISGNPAIPGFTGTDVSRNAFFRDYDLDGWLDILIVNDNNTGGDAGRTKIYMNKHPGGVFSTFAEEGLARLGSGTGGAACGATSFDADMDGDFDLYVGNYPGPSQDTMYFNDGLGFFTNVTTTHVPLDGDYSVDVSSADMNGDGKLDLLVTNGSDPSWVYYNDIGGGGSEVGDFSYTNSTYNLGVPSFESAMEPGDFDNDGDMDFYWSNRTTTHDSLYRNSGNDFNQHAVFIAMDNLPASVLNVTSRKATVADLNDDGRLDIVVAKGGNEPNQRPTILRNVTVNGSIQFVDWTPALAFPTGAIHKAWHAAAFDADGDQDVDLFLGGWANDHLFYRVDGADYLEAELKRNRLPGVVNALPASVLGTGGEGESDVYEIFGVPSAAFMSVVVNGADDYVLDILNGNDTVLVTIDRGGAGTEEATQYDPAAMPATVKLRITIAACASPFNLGGDCGVGIADFLALLIAWGPNPGHPADFDDDGSVAISDMLALLAAWGPSNYNAEVLIRTD